MNSEAASKMMAHRIPGSYQKSIVFILFLAFYIKHVSCIDCFKCISYNGGNKACDDPFHNNYSSSLLESPCMGGRKGRDGLFPATACIKISGYYDGSEETITVRGCALDSGTLTTDTEIIRMSHCGKFYYDGRYVHGCLQSCSDADACNSAPAPLHVKTLTSSTAKWVEIFKRSMLFMVVYIFDPR